MRSTALGVTLVVVIACGACHKEEPVPLGEGYGCIGIVQGREANCTELDPGTTIDERIAFANACTNSPYKNMAGRMVRHCGSDVAAKCALPNEKATQRLSKAQATEGALRGTRIACASRGGTFSGP